MAQDPLARKLRVLRAERGLTLRDVEAITGVDKHTVSYAERGIRKPFPTTLRKLAEGYGVSVAELMEDMHSVPLGA
jgi:transcriptional regulator with XRE-family HTH domain